MKDTSKLPGWIRPAFRKKPYLDALAPKLRSLGVSTICETARCPNLGECFSCGSATFLIMGEICTRNCRFCAVESGRPERLDPEEPARIARAVKELGLKHTVLTCVTRDDLPDGGAAHFVAVMEAIRQQTPGVSVEPLVSDMQGNMEAVATIVEAKPEVFAHNVETAPRLYPRARPQADWQRSLKVLEKAAAMDAEMLVKSGLMVGLGEEHGEVIEVLKALRGAGVDIITVGQYLQPTSEHLPVERYVTPEEYTAFEAAAREMGFAAVYAGPLVRSSYRAAEALAAAKRE